MPNKSAQLQLVFPKKEFSYNDHHFEQLYEAYTLIEMIEDSAEYSQKKGSCQQKVLQWRSAVNT